MCTNWLRIGAWLRTIDGRRTWPDTVCASGQIKRPAVVRMALDCGLPMLEKKYPPKDSWLDTGPKQS
jgi:hypothetical protein